VFHTLVQHLGYCAGCADERPLVVLEHGPRGLRAWLAGIGAEDRALSYACLVCGRTEHVPLTEAEDAEYDATLPRWADPLPALVVVPSPPRAVVRPQVRIITLPAGDLTPTYSHALALSA
jgi:hypothetical protein